MRKGRPKIALILTTEERQRLDSLAHRSRSAAAVARRARIILACAEGLDSKVVAPSVARHARHSVQMARSVSEGPLGRAVR